MGLQADRMKATYFQYPDAIPVRIGFLGATWAKYGDALADVIGRYPEIHAAGSRTIEGTHKAGTHVDAWGCVWSNIAEGMEAIVTGHPVPTREAVHTLRTPEVDAGLPHGFMYLRLADLRGFEEPRAPS